MSGPFERTFGAVAAALEAALFTEATAERRGLLQAIEPRAKMVGFVVMLLAVGLAQRLETLLALCLLPLAMAAASRLPLASFMVRVWAFVPLFTAAIALPALFLTPGPPIVGPLEPPLLPVAIVVTETGLRAAVSLVLRVGASVSLAMLLVGTTPWPRLLRALRALRLPKTVVAMLAMTYRYIFLLLRLSQDLMLARESRRVGRLSSGDERRWLATAAGVLFARTQHLGDEVYLAMLSRGYRGEVAVARERSLQWRDWLFLWATLVAAAVAAGIGRWL